MPLTHHLLHAGILIFDHPLSSTAYLNQASFSCFLTMEAENNLRDEIDDLLNRN